jgi:rhomboid protease GluP
MFNNAPGESRFPTEQPVQRIAAVRPTSVVTLTLIGINVLVFIAMVLSGLSPISPTGEQLLAWGANYGPFTVGGQWWRLLTACFLHFGIIHLGFNMYVLYQVGMSTEFLFGKVKYLLIYILSGLIGNLVSVYVHPLSVGAGASGAVFGVYGAFLGFLLTKRSVIPKQAMTQMAKSAGIFLGINLIYGVSDGSTDLSAHIGGLSTGFLLGMFLLWTASSRAGRLQR